MVARLDRAHAAPGWSAPGRGPGRRGVVRLPRGPADGWRYGVAAHRHGGRAREPARRPVGSPRAPGGWRLAGGVCGPGGDVGLLAPGGFPVATALGATLGAADRRRDSAGLDRIRRGRHGSGRAPGGICGRRAARRHRRSAAVSGPVGPYAAMADRRRRARLAWYHLELRADELKAACSRPFDEVTLRP